MKIVYLAAGAGGMYCGSCLHDNTLAAALLALGEDVTLVPTYTPLRTDEDNVSDSHLFFGGINVYLQQRMSLFRHTPWFFDDLLNRPGLFAGPRKGDPASRPKNSATSLSRCSRENTDINARRSTSSSTG